MSRATSPRTLTFLLPASAILLVGCGGSSTSSDDTRVAMDASAVAITYASGDSATAVTKGLTLPSVGAQGGSSITWSSSNPAVVSAAGKVSRPPYGVDASVTLTATVAYGGAQKAVAFPIVVKQNAIVQFLYTSDVHFGINTKGNFQGSSAPVDSATVNTQMVKVMNTLPALAAPSDYGVNAGATFGNFDFMAITGDIANRQEAGVQSATASWAQFQTTYVNGLTLKDNSGNALPIFLSPGNHDVSDAIGYTTTLNPVTDPTSFVNIYNTAFPNAPITNSSFDYSKHKVFYTKDFGGVHFIFLNMWPDSDMRTRIDADINALAAPTTTPVVLLMHMPPEQEAKNFADPASSGSSFVFTNGFQNLLVDKLDATDLDSKGKVSKSSTPTKEVQDLTAFLVAHKTIVAWFHGHDNFNEFRTWNGADGITATGGSTLVLPIFRVDSPLKGNFSSTDESKLSFQTIAIDPAKKLMTVRECLWNTTKTAGGPIAWGATSTVSLKVPRAL